MVRFAFGVRMAAEYTLGICSAFGLLLVFGQKEDKKVACGACGFGCDKCFYRVFYAGEYHLVRRFNLFRHSDAFNSGNRPCFQKINPYIGVFCCAVLFLFTFSIGERAVGIGDIRLFSLPDWLYRNYFTAYLGFAPNEFFSVDYVPVFPWIFLFWFGYFLYHIFKTNGFLKYLSFLRVKPMEYIGRNSLIIYIIHQPLVYALLYVWFKVL